MEEKRKVHIVMVGKTIENVIAGLIKVGANEIYPIISENYYEEMIVKLEQNCPSVKVHRNFKIDPFQHDSFFNIIDMMIRIVKSRKDEECEFFVNLTGGTNLMSAAAEAGAVLTKSKAYYIVEGKGENVSKKIMIPWHTLNPLSLDNQDIQILRIVDAHPGISNKIIKSLLLSEKKMELSDKKISLVIRKLKYAGYLESGTQNDDRRMRNNELTPWGRIAVLMFDDRIVASVRRSNDQ